LPELESLRRAFSNGTYWSEWATLLVFVGLVGDILVILLFDFSDKEKSRGEIAIAGIASLVIALGVWGEAHFGNRATNAAIQIQGLLGKEAADANERAARAEKATANARLEAAKIEKDVKWRHLDDIQVAFIEIPLSRFAGERIDVLTYFGDLEAEMFASRIVKALAGDRGADWKVTGGTIRYSPSIFSGVVVDTLPGAGERDREIAKYLIATLQYVGVAVFVLPPEMSGKGLKGQILAGHLDPKAFITLTVGVHPEPLPPPPPKVERK
jgi:hypothetical protein